MAQNEFTKKNHGIGMDGQKILDAGINVFGLQMVLESYTKRMGKDTGPVEFTYLGVDVKLSINENAKKQPEAPDTAKTPADENNCDHGEVDGNICQWCGLALDLEHEAPDKGGGIIL